jgi:hypothetical protein
MWISGTWLTKPGTAGVISVANGDRDQPRKAA